MRLGAVACHRTKNRAKHASTSWLLRRRAEYKNSAGIKVMVVEGSRDDDHFLDILTVSFLCQVMEQELKLQNPSLPVLSQRKSKNPWIFDTADLE